MNEDILRAWLKLKQQAQLAGRPPGAEETKSALYPELMAMRKRGIQDTSLALEKEKLATNQSQFNQTLALNQDIFNQQQGLQDEARPWQWAGLGISAAGNLGTVLYSMKQDELLKNRLAKLYAQYPGLKTGIGG